MAEHQLSDLHTQRFKESLWSNDSMLQLPQKITKDIHMLTRTERQCNGFCKVRKVKVVSHYTKVN